MYRELNHALDSVLGDFFEANLGKYPSGTTIRELMEWCLGRDQALDGPLGRFFEANPEKYAAATTVRELMEWYVCRVLVETERAQTGPVLSARAAAMVDVIDQLLQQPTTPSRARE